MYDEPWLHANTTSYRAQKATATIKSKIAKVEAFSNYIVSPLCKDYKVFHGTMMLCFKAIQCWLQLEPSHGAPEGWKTRKKNLLEHIESKFNCMGNTTPIEIISDDVAKLSPAQSSSNWR